MFFRVHQKLKNSIKALILQGFFSSFMATMFDPPHPGALLREDVLPALSLTVRDAAKQMGVSKAALSKVINEKAAVSPELALRLEQWLGAANGGSVRMWLEKQLAYDLWQARKTGAIH